MNKNIGGQIISPSRDALCYTMFLFIYDLNIILQICFTLQDIKHRNFVFVSIEIVMF